MKVFLRSVLLVLITRCWYHIPYAIKLVDDNQNDKGASSKDVVDTPQFTFHETTMYSPDGREHVLEQSQIKDVNERKVQGALS